eukprot:TRINITY_DN12544_c0_g2_i3.p1 TRINITY_DN12544_c0_g2~~TRINITY_DN12544_c0_g2_i3.p1  ORF type:complete len:283 (+),score=101.32 TRINITY_DN12544_c0_g2_i3:66-914(+)
MTGGMLRRAVWRACGRRPRAMRQRAWCGGSARGEEDRRLVWYALWRTPRGRRYLKWGLGVYSVLCAALWWLSAQVDTACKLLKEETAAEGGAQKAARPLPRLGGPLQDLTDHEGQPFDSTVDMAGKWWLVYFGFANCPTVCPAELRKITECLTDIERDAALPLVTPLFVTLDPERDTPGRLKDFLRPFHKRFVGLTGSQEVIEKAAKQFRVYFSVIDTEDQDLQPGERPEDYQLDHSCIIYLMSPEGMFCEFFSKETDSKVAAEKVRRHLDGTMAHIHSPDA